MELGVQRYMDDPVWDRSMITQGENPPLQPYEYGHIIYRHKVTVVEDEASYRGIFLTRAVSKAGPRAQKRMRMLHGRCTFRDGADL